MNLKEQHVHDLKHRLNDLPPLGIVCIVLGEDPATLKYVQMKTKMAEELGVQLTLLHLSGDSSITDLKDNIERFNSDPEITGIWVQLPLPKHLDEQTVCNLISAFKDVDCLTSENLGQLLHGVNNLLPATVRGVMSILAEQKTELNGMRVLVIGASPWLGKPMALALSNMGSSVTLVSDTEKNLEDLTRIADLIVSCVGKPNLITKTMVKPGAVIIDVGISVIDGKVIGDVAPDVSEIAKYVSPVPGGVGPMTVVSLFENLADIAQSPL